MDARINRHLDAMETLIQAQRPGSRYQFELLDLASGPIAKESLGFFSFFSRHNRLSFYELYDVLAFVGLVLAKMYSPSN